LKNVFIITHFRFRGCNLNCVIKEKKRINFANTVFYMEEFNFEEIKTKALEQLKSGKSLLGKDGAFAPLLAHP